MRPAGRSLPTPALGPKLANWFLEMIKKEIFYQHLSFYPSFCICFVNNVFTIFNLSADIQLFPNVHNNQHPNLCFTCEEASGFSLRYLNIEVMICNGEFNVSVYCKPTFTSKLLHFDSIDLCSENEALSLVYCIVPIYIHQMTL